MKAGWEEKSVGEVLRLEYGKSLDEADRKPDGRYPVYGANGEKDRTDKFYYDKPSIIIGRKGSAGEINLTEQKFWPLDVTYFVTFDERHHDLRFLYYLLTTLGLPSLAKGVKPGINRNEVYSQVTKVPLLPEQQRIVGILDKAFDGIAIVKANAEKNLQNAREIFESYLNSAFISLGEQWEQKKLAEICGFVRGPFGGSLKKATFKDSGYAVYEQTHAIYDQFDSIRYFIDEEKFKEMKRFELKPGDIIMSCSGATLGRVAIAPENVKQGIINQALLKLTPTKRISSVFLNRWMQSNNFQGSLKTYSQGAAIPNIKSVKFLKEIVIPVPTLSEQYSIVTKLDMLSNETKRLVDIYQQKLVSLDELKKALLHQAFNGEL